MKDATTDETTLRRWWLRWPDANIGIATGAGSGIVVLDLDNDRHGTENLFALEARYGDLPIGPIARTGKGYHCYFQHPRSPVKNTVGRDDLSGIDVRGDGGYVVAPPSHHVSGNEYLWEVGPDELAPPLMPDWIIKIFTSPTPAPVPPEIAGAGNPVREGQRNDVLFRLACSLRAKGLSEAAVIAALQAENRKRCKPPLAEGEVLAIDRSAARYPNSANSANSANAGADPSAWEPPTPFHEFELPPFPTDALPEPLRAFVLSLAIATQTPPDVAALLTLSVCAAACAKKIIVQIDEGWIEPVNLFTVSVLKPGNRKSAVFSAVVTPLQEYEAEECRRMAPEVEAARTRCNIVREALKNAERDAARASVAEQETRGREAERLSMQLCAMRITAMPRYIVDDSTPERLATLLHEQDGRMALLSPEGGVFDVMAGRYSQDGTAIDSLQI